MKGKGNDGTGNTVERDSWETDNEIDALAVTDEEVKKQ